MCLSSGSSELRQTHMRAAPETGPFRKHATLSPPTLKSLPGVESNQEPFFHCLSPPTIEFHDEDAFAQEENK